MALFYCEVTPDAAVEWPRVVMAASALTNYLVSRMPFRVCGFHALRTRKAGPLRFVDLHLQVDRSLSVEVSRRLVHTIGDAINGRFGNASVTVHVEPCDGRCTRSCIEGCLIGPRPQTPE